MTVLVDAFAVAVGDVAGATPINFLLNKVWTFHADTPRRLP